MTGDGKALFADSVGARVPPRARAQVHSVFVRACNIETESGELVTLLAAGSGNLPHGIRCASPIAPLFARLRQGQAATLEGAALRVPAADFAVDLSRAAVWNAMIAAVLPGLRGAELEGALRDLCETLREHAPDRGIAPALFSTGSPHSTLERALVARMAQRLPILARATETRDAGAVVSALSALVGLGTGLTPAGDDFIVGYLAALWSRSHREPGIAALLRALAMPVRQLSLHTNAISRQMLLDALQGHFAERLTEVVRCVCDGGDVTGAAMRTLEVGHSSGTDVLCGLVFGYSPALTARPIRACVTDHHFGDRHAARAAAIAC
ncbi:MAG TPA: DUF2877 domain-containing protein [Lysobacter sp.]|nr:DUF2877 domain-containing protein [Lysobacter sp.]